MSQERERERERQIEMEIEREIRVDKIMGEVKYGEKEYVCTRAELQSLLFTNR